MRRAVFIVIVVLIAVVLGYVVGLKNNQQGSNSYQNDGNARIPRPEHRDNEANLKDHGETIPKSGDPVNAAVSALLGPKKGEERVVPVGTRLLSLKVDNGIATLDFSSEFNGVRDYGTTQESLAQN